MPLISNDFYIKKNSIKKHTDEYFFVDSLVFLVYQLAYILCITENFYKKRKTKNKVKLVFLNIMLPLSTLK